MNDTVDQTQEVILKYWRSWQTPDWEAMRESLSEKLDFGEHTMSAEQFVEMCKKGSAWRDVELISSLFTEREGALLYEGTDTKTGNRIRVGEFVKVENGKVKSMVACFGTGTPPQ